MSPLSPSKHSGGYTLYKDGYTRNNNKLILDCSLNYLLKSESKIHERRFCHHFVTSSNYPWSIRANSEKLSVLKRWKQYDKDIVSLKSIISIISQGQDQGQ